MVVGMRKKYQNRDLPWLGGEGLKKRPLWARVCVVQHRTVSRLSLAFQQCRAQAKFQAPGPSMGSAPPPLTVSGPR